MKIISALLLLISFGICNGQNFIPNSSFEQYTSCPLTSGPIDSVIFWTNPTFSLLFGGNGGTPDYFNTCAIGNTFGVPANYQGYQQPLSGDAYVGMVLYGLFPTTYREYIQVSFTTPNNVLVANQCYHFKMYINLSNGSCRTTHKIGVYFSDSLVHGINNCLNLPFTPQIENIVGNTPDSVNWKLVSGDYVAKGAETHLIIGNFSDENTTSPSVINLGCTSTNKIYVYIDDVSLTPCNPVGLDNQDEINLSISPNPFMDILKIKFNNTKQAEIVLYDLFGRKCLQKKFINEVLLNTEYLSNGMYLYSVLDNNNIVRKGKLIKQ